MRKNTVLWSVLALSALCMGSPGFAAEQAQSPAPNDAQIAAIVVAANSVDVAAGKFAERKTHDREVRKFAKRMVTDHTAVNKQAVALVRKLKVTPESNGTSQALEKGGQENLAHLRTLKGHAFDKAYVDHEVAYHQEVLDAIDNTLLPSAQNPELKALIKKVRPAIAAHLEHAKMIQSRLGS